MDIRKDEWRFDIPTPRDLYGPPNIDMGEYLTVYGHHKYGSVRVRVADEPWMPDESEMFWTMTVEHEDGSESEVYWDNGTGKWRFIDT